MADFNVDLQQPRAAGANVVAPVQRIPDSPNTALLQFGASVVTGLMRGKEEADKKRKEEYKNAIISDFAREQTSLNQALMQGAISKTEAADRARANISKYVGSYSELTDEFVKINKGLFEYSELGVVKSEEDQSRDLRKQALSDMQKDGMFIPPSASESTITSMVQSYQETRAERMRIEQLYKEGSFRRAESAEERQSYEFEVKKKTATILANLGASHLTASQNFIRDIASKAKSGADPAALQLEVDTYFGNIEGAIAATAAANPELAAQWRTLFDKTKVTAGEALSGKATSDILEGQLKEVKTRAQLAALQSNAKMQGLYAVTSLLNGNLVSLTPDLNEEALNAVVSVAEGAGNRMIVGDRDSEKLASQVIVNGVNNIKTGKPSATTEALGKVGNNILRGLENVAFDEGRVEAKQLNTVVDLLAKPEFAYLVEKGIVDKQLNVRAKQAFQTTYQKEVASSIVNTMNKEFTFTGGVKKDKLANLVDIQWSGSGVSFLPKDTAYLSPVDRQDRSQYVRELNSSGIVLNKLIRVGAHMEGHTNYAEYWDKNKHLIVPGLYLPVGTKDGEYEYVGPGFTTDQNSWKKVGGE